MGKSRYINLNKACLTLLLCAAIVTALLPFAATAANEPVTVTNAAGVTTSYASFDLAWAAAVKEKTATIRVERSVSAGTAGVSISAADLNFTLEIPAGVTLTMPNMGIRYSKAGKLCIRGGGTITAASGTYAAVQMSAGANAVLEIDGCNITSTGTHAVHVNGGKATIRSGSFTGAAGGYGFFTNGGSSSTIRIESGRFAGGKGGLGVAAAAYDGVRYLSDLVDLSAVAFRYAGNGGGWTQGRDLKELNNSYGAVSVDPVPLALELLSNNLIVLNPGGSTELSVAARAEGEVVYQWYRDNAPIDGATGAGYALPSDMAPGSTTYFYCAASYAGFTAQTAQIQVRVAPSGASYACWYAVSGGEPYFSATLDRAFSSVAGAPRAEVHLMQDVTLEDTIRLARGNISFYGDGHTLEGEALYLFQVSPGAQLTIMNGTIHPTRSRNSYAFYMQGGTVTMRGGTILCDQTQSYGFYCSGGTLNFGGGTIRAAESGCVGIFSGSAAVANISGGVIDAPNAGAIALSVADGGTMNVSGGNFSGAGNVVFVNTGKVGISGGKFSGRVHCTANAGSLSKILSKGFAFKLAEGEGAGWVTKPDTLTFVEGVMDVLPIPAELLSFTETVPMLVNGYSSAPTLSVSARARTPDSPLTYQWYRDGAAIDGATGTSYQIPLGLENIRINFACAITCEGYETRTENIVVTVAPHSYIHEVPTGLTVLYGLTLRDVPLPNPEGNSEGEWSWEKPGESVGNVGVNSFAAVFTPKLGWLYEPVHAQVSIEVYKTSPRIVIDSAYLAKAPLDKVYNGLAARQPDPYYIKVENGKSDAKMVFRWYDAEGTLLSAAPKAAGSYEVEAYLPETHNANAASARMPVQIAAKRIEPNVILDSYSYAYDRTAKTPGVTVRDGKVVVSPEEYTFAYANNTLAGTATVTVTDKPGGNYVFDIPARETFDINRVILTVTGATATGKVYDGESDVAVSNVGLSGRVYLNNAADDVSVDTTKLSGYVTYDGVHADTGTYSRVSFRDILTLTGTAANNYILQQPSGEVSLTSAIEITKYDIPADKRAVLDVSAGEDERFVSNRYNFIYQWPVTVLYPEVEEPMQWTTPAFSWTAALDPAFYRGSASSDAPSEIAGRDVFFTKDRLCLPIGWEEGQQPMIADDVNIPIGTITLTMQPKNYEPITYTLKVLANTKVTALIIDWQPAPSQEYNGQGVRGYAYSPGKDAIGVRPVDLPPEAPLPEDVKNVKITVSYTGREGTAFRQSDRTPMPVNAGQYLVTASVDRNDKNYIGIDSLEFEVRKTAPSYATHPTPSADTLSYTGRVIPLITEGTSPDGELIYSLSASGPFSSAIPFGVDVGDYPVYYKILGDRNHLDSPVSTITVTIVKSAPYFVAPRPISGLMYDGYPEALVVPGRTADGTMVYSLDGVNFSGTVPVAKDVGSYTVYYKVVGDRNHFDSEVGQVTVNVGVVQLNVRSITAYTRPYDGTADVRLEILFYESAVGDDLGLKYNAQLVLDERGHAHAGIYERVDISDLRLTGKDAANYQLGLINLPNVLLEEPVEITKAETSKTLVNKFIKIYSPVVYEWDLNELIPPEIPAALRALNKPTFELGRISFDEPYYSGGARVEGEKFIIPIDEVDAQTANRVGSVAFTLYFENYKDVLGGFVLKSSFKPETTITGVESAGQVPYTGNGVLGFVGIPTSDHTGEYDITYEGIPAEAYPLTSERPVNIGRYHVTIRIPSTDQGMSGSLTLPFEIVRALPVITGIPEKPLLYVTKEPQPLLSEISVSGGTLEFALEVEGEPLAWSTEIPTAQETGEYVVWYRVVENENYLPLEPASLTVVIRNRPMPGGNGDSANAAIGGVTASDIDGVLTATVDSVLAERLAKQVLIFGCDSVQITVETGSVRQTPLRVIMEPKALGSLSAELGVPVTVLTPTATFTLRPATLADLAARQGELCVDLRREEDGVHIGMAMAGAEIGSLPGGIAFVIPCENASPATVAVLVGEDGSETILRKSVAGTGCLGVVMEGSGFIKWVERGVEFTDVAADHWAAESIRFVGSHALMNGVGEGAFSPAGVVTRGMLAQLLFNMEGAPQNGAAGGFRDVPSDGWYAAAVDWAAAQGFVQGYGDNTFGPEGAITREQLATILYRYLGNPNADEVKLEEFRDAGQISAYALPAMRWAVQSGLLRGRAEQLLEPGGAVTRAETAIVLQRLCRYMTGAA